MKKMRISSALGKRTYKEWDYNVGKEVTKKYLEDGIAEMIVESKNGYRWFSLDLVDYINFYNPEVDVEHSSVEDEEDCEYGIFSSSFTYNREYYKEVKQAIKDFTVTHNERQAKIEKEEKKGSI